MRIFDSSYFLDLFAIPFAGFLENRKPGTGPEMKLVIVESPAKAKTINKYLGSAYQVLASLGHVRDLPAKNGSVLPEEDFSMTWEVGDRARKQIAEIVQAAKKADTLILATDPDREGEAISWHVLQVLKDKKALGAKPVQRVVFNEITKAAILEAMKHPREIDAPLVEAYLARRALDYLVGFGLSPVLWRKLPGARSAGRVQSVALRLICDRELEIEAFRAQEYWTIEGEFSERGGPAPAGAPRQTGWREGGEIHHQDRGRRRSRPRADCDPRLPRQKRRKQTRAAHAASAFHYLHPAAGSLAQAGLQQRTHHADRPAPL